MKSEETPTDREAGGGGSGETPGNIETNASDCSPSAVYLVYYV